MVGTIFNNRVFGRLCTSYIIFGHVGQVMCARAQLLKDEKSRLVQDFNRLFFLNDDSSLGIFDRRLRPPAVTTAARFLQFHTFHFIFYTAIMIN